MDLISVDRWILIIGIKLTISFYIVDGEKVDYVLEILPFRHVELGDGLKYMGFHLKTNNYLKEDWR